MTLPDPVRVSLPGVELSVYDVHGSTPTGGPAVNQHLGAFLQQFG
jgi:hypothetical protein